MTNALKMANNALQAINGKMPRKAATGRGNKAIMHDQNLHCFSIITENAMPGNIFV